MIPTFLACPPNSTWQEAAALALPVLALGLWLTFRLYRSPADLRTKAKIASIAPVGLYLVLLFNFTLLLADAGFELANGTLMAFIFGLGLACRHYPFKHVQTAGVIHTSLAGILLVNLLMHGIYLIVYFNWSPRPEPPSHVLWLWLVLWLPFSIWLARRGYHKAIRKIAGRYCLKCDYDLRGSTQSNACPECGQPIPPINQ